MAQGQANSVYRGSGSVRLALHAPRSKEQSKTCPTICSALEICVKTHRETLEG